MKKNPQLMGQGLEQACSKTYKWNSTFKTIVEIPTLPINCRHLVVKILIYICMLLIFSTPVIIRYLQQLKTVVFLHRCLIRALLLVHWEPGPVQLLTVWWICWQDNNITTWRNGLCKSKLDPRKKKKIELVKDIRLVQL